MTEPTIAEVLAQYPDCEWFIDSRDVSWIKQDVFLKSVEGIKMKNPNYRLVHVSFLEGQSDRIAELERKLEQQRKAFETSSTDKENRLREHLAIAIEALKFYANLTYQTVQKIHGATGTYSIASQPIPDPLSKKATEALKQMGG